MILGPLCYNNATVLYKGTKKLLGLDYRYATRPSGLLGTLAK
jgi:hypothetical protein